MLNRWKSQIAELERRIADGEAELQRLRELGADMTRVISITKDGNKLKLLFQRNNDIFELATYATMDVDINYWRSKLLG